MKNKLDCHVVEDLLPLYNEDLVSEKTKEQVEEHLNSCSSCHKKWESMQENVQNSFVTDQKDIDYLKTIRKKTKHQKIFVSLFSIFAIIIIGLGFYFKGSEASFEDINYQIQESETGDILLEIKPISSSQRIVRTLITYQDQDVVIKFYTSPTFFFKQEVKVYVIGSRDHIQKMTLGKSTLWENKKTISTKANLLYQAKNNYIGDISADLKLAEILEIDKQFGTFTSHLQTDDEPYGWEIRFSQSFDSINQNYEYEKMERNAYLLLALIDNLDYIEWHMFYGQQEYTYSISKEDASQFCRKDIKDFSKNIYDLQCLLDLLKMN